MSLTGHSSSWLLCDLHPSKSDIFRNTLWVHVRVHKKKHMTSVTYEELEVALAANATFLVCIAPLSNFTVRSFYERFLSVSLLFCSVLNVGLVYNTVIWHMTFLFCCIFLLSFERTTF